MKIAIFKSHDEIFLFDEILLDDEIFIIRQNDKGRYYQFSTEEPTLNQLEEWVYEGISEAIDGCSVEPDGECMHGYPSWLIKLGII